MPQGKLKVKAKAPSSAKSKKKSGKGAGVSKRGNRAITPKKQKQGEAQKLKKIISKNVNKAMEEDLRAKALDGKKSLGSKKEGATRASKRSKK